VIQTGQGTATVTYAYNGADQVTVVSYTKDGTVRRLGYVYDRYGRIDRITVQLGNGSVQTVRQYVYKSNGDLDYTRDYREFDTAGQGYIDTAYTLNGAGMTTDITYKDSSDASGIYREKYHMDYDKRGYITAETSTTNYGSSSSASKSYTYDEIGRLTQATIGGKTNTYTYDSVGNRLTKNNETYHYNEFNQLTSITGSKNETYTYDGRGNQTSKGIDTYAYNLMDQLARANVHVWVGVSGYGYDKIYSEVNSYNAAGQRVKMTLLEDGVDYGASTKYYYTGSDLLYTTNTDNNVLTESILDLNGGVVASKRFIDESGSYSEKYYFYHTDIRGSTTNIVKPDGSRMTGYTYDEFGNLESQNGSTKFLNEVTFTGSVYSKTTGLQYMNARFYSPSTGRFLSQDSYTGNPYDPWTQHLYSYCGNNPTNFIDPTGHNAISNGDWTKEQQKNVYPIGTVLITKGKSKLRLDSQKNIEAPKKTESGLDDWTVPIKELMEYKKQEFKNYKINDDKSLSLNERWGVIKFALQVKTGGELDLKNESSWNLQFDKDTFPESKEFFFDGKIITAEILGNMTYGYLGSYLNYSSTLLFQAGGFVQTHSFEHWNDPPYYGDNPDDRWKIQAGIDWYYNEVR
jgi:RHS repeat-associated protein